MVFGCTVVEMVSRQWVWSWCKGVNEIVDHLVVKREVVGRIFRKNVLWGSQEEIVGTSFVLSGQGRRIYFWLCAIQGHHRVASPGFELGTLTLAVALLVSSGLLFESWGGHSVTPLTGTEPNILKTNDVPTMYKSITPWSRINRKSCFSCLSF